MQLPKRILLCLFAVLQTVKYAQPSVCSDEENGQFFIPPDFPEYYEPANASSKLESNALMKSGGGGTQSNILYITTITIPSNATGCQGTVTAIEFCYLHRTNNMDIDAVSISFEFYFLNANSNFQRNGSRSISSNVNISSDACHDPGGSGQRNIICCDTQDLEFTLAVGKTTFGIVMGNNALIYAAVSSNNQIERFETNSFGSDPFTATSTSDSLLVRLIVDIPTSQPPTEVENMSSTAVSTEDVTTNMTPTEALATQISPTTVVPPSTESELMTSSSTSDVTTPMSAISSGLGPSTTRPITSMTSVEPTTVPEETEDGDMTVSPNIVSPTSDADPASTTTEEPPVGVSVAAVGGAVGGVIVAILLAMVACVMLLMLRKRRKQRDQHAIDNAIYEGVGEGPSYNGPLYIKNEYAGIGPATAMDSGDKDLEMPHEYADLGATYEILLEPLKGTLPPPDLPDPVSNYKEEDVYMVPATDENSLYAQLGDILALNISRSWVKLGSQLGSGQFGVVYRGVLDSSEGEEVEVAVKTLKEGSAEEDRVKFLQEAAIMGQFKHHNVVTMHGVVTQGEPVLLVLELLTKGDLRDYLIHMRSGEEGGDVSVDGHTLLSYCRQVASGMAYLSNKAFVHRDLAARNILVSDDDICKIADFGMSRDLANENYYVSQGGKIPVKWTAPEALHYKKYSTASDVWSYGILMYEIWSVGYKPYQNQANNVVLRLVGTGYRLPPPPGCPRALYNIMIACWHPEPSQRPSFPEVTRQLSLPDPKLLKWSEEDKCVHPEAAKLGADLKCGQELYKDLQTQYIQKQ